MQGHPRTVELPMVLRRRSLGRSMLLCLFRLGLACAWQAVSSFNGEKRDRRIALLQRNWGPLFSVRIRLPTKLEPVPARPEDYASVTLVINKSRARFWLHSRTGATLARATVKPELRFVRFPR
jgi:hypothetical protein